MFAIEGLDVGQDLYTPVSEDYEVPFAFSGAIAEVTIELGSNQVLDREAELLGRIIAAVAGSPGVPRCAAGPSPGGGTRAAPGVSCGCDSRSRSAGHHQR